MDGVLSNTTGVRVNVFLFSLAMCYTMTLETTNQSTVREMLRNPYTGNDLIEEGGDMVDPKTDERFPIEDGIPVVLRDEDIVGMNRTYQKRYDWLSYVYDLWDVPETFKQIADSMVIAGDDHVLETSIGTGLQVKNLHDHGKDAIFFGNDLSFGMLRKCRKNARKWAIDIGLVQGNAETLPYRDELFDVVYHIGGINFFTDKQAAVQEMIRVAKHGANIYIGDETEALLDYQLPIFNRFYQDPEPGVYDPPVKHIPDKMLDVLTTELWNGNMYMISFRKPDA